MEPRRNDAFYLTSQKSRNDVLYSNLIDARAEYRDRIWLELASFQRQLQPTFDDATAPQKNEMKRLLAERYKDIQSQDQLRSIGTLLPLVPMAAITGCATLTELKDSLMNRVMVLTRLPTDNP